MQLYSLNGGYPAPVLFDDFEDADGKLWTGLREDPAGLAACGFVAVPAPPSYDAATQALTWANGAWSISDLPPPALAQVQAQALAALQAEFDARIAAGFTYSGHPVQLDDGSQARLTAVGATAALAKSGAVAWPDGYAQGWIAADKVRIPMATPDAGIALSVAVGAYYSALVQHELDLDVAIMAAADAAGVAAVDVTAGWPAQG